MDEQPDAVIAREIQAGGADRGAAETQFCRRFAPRIRLYGLKHLRDEERARDLVQSALVAVLEALRAGRVDDPERVDRFVLGTCRNLVHRMRASDARAEPIGDETLARAMTVEIEQPQLSSLVRCVDALELRAKTVVRLSFQGARSAEEIALELAITPGNVRVLRHRAILALRRCLDLGTEGTT